MEHPPIDPAALNDLALDAVAKRLNGESPADGVDDALSNTEAGKSALQVAEILAEAVREQDGDMPPTHALRKAQAIAGTSPLARFSKELDKLASGARRIVASLDLDSRLSRPMHSYRGATEATQLAFSSDACEVDIELDAVGEEWCITGQLSCDADESWSVEVISASDERLECLDRFRASTTTPFTTRVPEGVFFLLLRRGDTLVELGPVIVP